MIFFVLRAAVVLAIIFAIYFVINRIIGSSDSVRCDRCEGKGFWYDARGKEKCDWCKGEGRLPRNS